MTATSRQIFQFCVRRAVTYCAAYCAAQPLNAHARGGRLARGRRRPRPSGWRCGQRRPGGFGVPGGGEASAGGLPGGGVLEDQILGDLAPAQRQELGELILIRFAGDVAADDDMRGDALVPYRARDDQALDIEQGIWQQATEPLEPAAQVCLAR